MNTELLGLSIDSVNSHIAWVRNIEENFGTKIDFPVIADLSMEVAEKFGMIMSIGSSTEASPADWQKGDKFIVPPAKTQEGAEERTNNKDYECVDFYFCKRDL